MKCCFCKYTLLGMKMKNPDLASTYLIAFLYLLNGVMCSFVTGPYSYKLSTVLISKHIYNYVSTFQ
jgi:hypothetical protein